jgi:hypothetical protein
MTGPSGRVEPQPCDLCGLPIDGAPWILETPARPYAFCCDGCLGIFQMLHDIDATTAPAPAPSGR